MLSPATANHARGEKFVAYRSVSGFQEYLVEHWWRTDDDRWHLEELRGLEAIVELQHLPARLALAEIYRRVEFAS